MPLYPRDHGDVFRHRVEPQQHDVLVGRVGEQLVDLLGADRRASRVGPSGDAHAYGYGGSIPGKGSKCEAVHLPLTHVKIFGWHDIEMGSYTYRLGALTAHVAKHL
jgi:hypothetical protein